MPSVECFFRLGSLSSAVRLKMRTYIEFSSFSMKSPRKEALADTFLVWNCEYSSNATCAGKILMLFLRSCTIKKTYLELRLSSWEGYAAVSIRLFSSSIFSGYSGSSRAGSYSFRKSKAMKLIFTSTFSIILTNFWISFSLYSVYPDPLVNTKIFFSNFLVPAYSSKVWTALSNASKISPPAN